MNIKKLLLISLMSVSLPAFAQGAEGLNADWMLMSEGKGSSQYANFKTLKIDGSKVLIWEANVNKPENKSRKTYMEYDCLNKQFRVLSVLVYGDTIFSDLKQTVNTASEPFHIPPDSYPSSMQDILCVAAMKRK